MPMSFIDDKSTLVQVMAWCRQATSHYLNQCWQDLCHYMVSLTHNELILVSSSGGCTLNIVLLRFNESTSQKCATKCLFFVVLVSFVCVFHWGCILTELFLINYSELNSWQLISWSIASPCHKQWCYWKSKIDWGRISTTGATSEWRNHMKSLTLKRIGHFFQNVISFSNVHHKWNIFIWNYETVQYNECLFSIVDTDGLVL